MTAMEQERGLTESASPAEIFESIYRTQRKWVEGVFFNWFEDWTLAEDLTAELFEKMWRNLSSGSLVIENPERPRGLLFTMAKYARLGVYKRRGPVSPSLDDDRIADDKREVLARAAESVLDVAEVAAGNINAGHLLAMLPPKQREALALRFFADMPPAAVAEATGWPQRTVTYHTKNGLDTLREAHGLPKGDPVHRQVKARDEEMRRVYRDSIAAGSPLTLAELGRRFGRDEAIARKVVAGIEAPAKPLSDRARVRIGLTLALGNGTYPAGSLMPSTLELAREYGTSSSTPRDVYMQLLAAHLVTRFEGRYYAGDKPPAVADPNANTSAWAKKHDRAAFITAAGLVKPVEYARSAT